MKTEKDDLRKLEIFWNEKNKHVRIRTQLTDFLAAYIVKGDIADPLFLLEMSLFKINMFLLEQKGLVKKEIGDGTPVWSLTAEGQYQLRRRHPKLKTWLQDLIASMPNILVIISGIIGFLASVAGIIQFYDWISQAHKQ